MKTLATLFILLFTQSLMAQTLVNNIEASDSITPAESQTQITIVKNGPEKYFEVGMHDYRASILQGKNVLVKVGNIKYRGVLGIIDDSTIAVNDQHISLNDIDMIATPRTGKTIGLVFAQLPIMFTGFVLAAWGATSWGYGFSITDEDTWIGFGGIATMAIGITAATIESKNGKRYRKFRVMKDEIVKQKWSYAIKSL